jgi:hypothetical protein
MTRWEQKPLFPKCGEEKPLFKNPSILLIPQQHTPPKDFSQSPFQPQTPQTHPAEKEMQVLMLKIKWRVKHIHKIRLKMRRNKLP